MSRESGRVIHADYDLRDDFPTRSVFAYRDSTDGAITSSVHAFLLVTRIAKAFHPGNENSLSVLHVKFFYSRDTDARGESHRTLLRLALIGTNYSVYVIERTRDLTVQTRVCINLYLFDADRSTLPTKLNRSSE